MNLELLKNEIVNDPLNRGYLPMTAQQISSSLNNPDRVIRELVPLWLVKKTIIEMGKWGTLVIASQSNPTVAIKSLAIDVVSYIDDPSGKFETLDMDLQSTTTMLGGLVSAGLINQTQLNTVRALANTTKSRAEELSLGFIEEKHVRDARSLI